MLFPQEIARTRRSQETNFGENPKSRKLVPLYLVSIYFCSFFLVEASLPSVEFRGSFFVPSDNSRQLVRHWCSNSDGSTSVPFWLDDRTSGRFRVALVFKSPMARQPDSLWLRLQPRCELFRFTASVRCVSRECVGAQWQLYPKQ